ncbi:PREDICTED: uncharacterized protein LOC108565091 [Nicrophorus vespilloides]|uniref:Uncharacterized protein LOC108565091 n=1 Tax=Nicrophorus vespilloides TaxID=110193 RepID=A0ABM1MZ63_NICVS|nr:PREDICTED: uncharacterized protein LOC108565091 [Nicrophorus vespilloides]
MISIVCLTFLVVLSSARWMPPAGSISLINRPDFDFLNDDYNVSHSRSKRYIGLSKRYKLNRRYQECVAPGEVEGHCKHVIYCPLDVVGISGKAALDYLCIIEKIHVGVCCPDDILLQSLTGAQLIMDLPAGGEEYDDEDAFTGSVLILNH